MAVAFIVSLWRLARALLSSPRPARAASISTLAGDRDDDDRNHEGKTQDPADDRRCHRALPSRLAAWDLAERPPPEHRSRDGQEPGERIKAVVDHASQEPEQNRHQNHGKCDDGSPGRTFV